jgi:hypothetical protein
VDRIGGLFTCGVAEGQEHGVAVDVDDGGNAWEFDKFPCCHWGFFLLGSTVLGQGLGMSHVISRVRWKADEDNVLL